LTKTPAPERRNHHHCGPLYGPHRFEAVQDIYRILNRVAETGVSVEIVQVHMEWSKEWKP